MFKNLAEQRAFGSRALSAALWLLVPVVALAGGVFGTGALGLGLAAAAIAGLGSVVRRLDAKGGATRMVLGVALMSSVSLLVAAARGHAWQIDMHMAYFAALAVVIIYCDWRAIAASTVTVAAHHLVLSFVLPALVFPGGGDLARVTLHAVILLVEAAVLMWAGDNIARMFERTERSLAEAATARTAAEASGAAAEAARTSEAEASREREQLQHSVDRERAAVVDGLAQGLQRLARGELGYRIGAAFPARYEELRGDYNAAMERLEEMVRGIAQSSVEIRSGSAEVSHAAGDLSQRTEQQAASLEEIAAALADITTTLRRSADGAQAAAGVVVAARGDARASGEVVQEAISAMSAIEASAGEIGQIIGVIDEIAFQTNLLALNAGVEAARAGDAGKGFAVVASEVRALAQRSADAAKEIKTLIGASAEQVSAGVELVGKTGEALERIVGRVAEIDGLIGEIAQGATEQASNVSHVSQSVGQIDQMTQRNAAMVNESTVASRSLAEQAARLASALAHFQVGGEEAAASRQAA